MADIADRGSDLEEQQRADALAKISRRTIEEPLLDEEGRRICRDCEEPIPFMRVKAVPHAVRCVPCQSIHEGDG